MAVQIICVVIILSCHKARDLLRDQGTFVGCLVDVNGLIVNGVFFVCVKVVFVYDVGDCLGRSGTVLFPDCIQCDCSILSYC